MPVNSSSGPTPYAGVNEILRLLLAQVHAILGSDLVGFYLYGSLSSGNFDPDSSDIDFLVVTEGELSSKTLDELAAMHARIAVSGSPWATRLEGSYIPRAALRRYDPANARHPTIGLDWDFGIQQHGMNWIIERHIVREAGVALYGPPPHTLIEPVAPDAMRAAALDALCNFWARQTDGPEWLRRRHYQAFAILTMCRILYTIEHGEPASKPVAAAWAQQALGQPWADLIAAALASRHDERPSDMSEMIRFIRFTLERCGCGAAAPAEQAS